ncbi:MAG: LOG family protein [Gammaproteobacteria bacterium]|nr:LOG family protein [Gammaproteobacteria bacterium]MDH3466474.1 LOG family protein [Gammaproteobacteria bacterium]
MSANTLEDVLDEVSEIYTASGDDLATRLYREILLNSLKFKRSDLDTLDLKIVSRAMAEIRYAARVFKPYRNIRKASIFGSARTPEQDPYYVMAVKFAKELVAHEFMVITGAAHGIMKAGIVGAGADKSFGVNILLPLEQGANEVIIDDPKLITFRYFFTRKLFFLMEAHAVALFPGGFGTHDEGFETLTLLQSGKAPPMPLVLMELPHENYWESWDEFVREQMLNRGLIAAEDLSLYKIVHSAQDGVEWIRHFYSTYHSSRQVGNDLIIRLERELTDNQIDELNECFPDLLSSGKIRRTAPLPAEQNEPHSLAKPRIVLAYNKKSPGRRTEMILHINKLGASK